MKRLVSIVEKRAVVRASELYPFGVHPHDLSKAASQGLLVKIGRGLYTRREFPSNIKSPSPASEYPMAVCVFNRHSPGTAFSLLILVTFGWRSIAKPKNRLSMA
jgi:hypothetical protein